MTEFAGLLREAVAIEQWRASPDEHGVDAGTWAPGGVAWAGLVPVDPSLLAVVGERRVGRPRYRLTVRAGSGAGVTSRFRWRGQVLVVIRPEPDPRTPDRDTFLVEDRT